ncbi:MAG: DUF4215 domain-containing protein [Candidatus Binatia bacterium]
MFEFPKSLRTLVVVRLAWIILALHALAVPSSQAAGFPCTITLGVAAAAQPIGSLSWTLDYSLAPGHVSGQGSFPDCQSRVPGAVAAFFDDDEGALNGAVIAEPPFVTPRDLVECTFLAAEEPVPGDFLVTTSSAHNGSVEPIVPLPVVAITEIECEPDVASTSTTTTTLPQGDCEEWDIRFRLDAASDAVGSLLLTVDYGDAAGEFDGPGSEVDCTNFVAGALFARQDHDATENLVLGMLMLAPLEPPALLAQCRFTASSPGILPAAGDFQVTVDDATDGESELITATVSVEVTPAEGASNCGTFCGNGTVETAESCDDGNLSNLDACLNDCALAVCGDGYLRAGVEECDDGNAAVGDGCSPACLATPICGDPVEDGRILVGDALRTLQRGVGVDVDCPDWTCDVNRDLRVTAGDAFALMKASIGLPVPLECGEPTALVLRLVSPLSLGGLQLDVHYLQASADLPGDGPAVHCEGLLPHTTFAFHDKVGDILSMSSLTLDGFSGPVSLARCELEPGGRVHTLDFPVSVIDAVDPDGLGVPNVHVRAIPY